MPQVSVIIPAHNAARFIHETIKSVRDQAFEDLEIILVDDGSTDSIREFFPEFSAVGVKCFSQTKSGASTARNYGLEVATGDYIQFLDADDLLHPDKLRVQLQHMIQQEVELSFTLWSSFTGTLKSERRVSYLHDYKASKSGLEMLASFGNDGWFVPVHAWLTSRTLLKKAGYWNPNLSTNDDGEFFSRVLCHCDRLVCVDHHFAYYRHENQNSLSRLNTERKLESAYNSWQLIHALVASLSSKEALAYPQRAYYILFWESFNANKHWVKLFARQFDKLNKLNKYQEIRKFAFFSLLVDWLGLYRGLLVHRSLKWFPSVCMSFLKKAKSA